MSDATLYGTQSGTGVNSSFVNSKYSGDGSYEFLFLYRFPSYLCSMSGYVLSSFMDSIVTRGRKNIFQQKSYHHGPSSSVAP